MTEEEEKIMIRIFGLERALLNEKTLIGLEMVNENIDEINLILPDGMELISHNSLDQPIREKNGVSYSFIRSKLGNTNLLSIWVSQTKRDIKMNPIPIKFEVFSQKERICEKTHLLNILLPRIEINLSKGKNLPRIGLVDVEIIAKGDLILTINKLDLLVYQQGTNNHIPVKLLPVPIEEYWELLDKWICVFPHQINLLETHFGQIELDCRESVDIEVKIYAEDLRKNIFEISSKRISILVEELQAFQTQPLNIPTYTRILNCALGDLTHE